MKIVVLAFNYARAGKFVNGPGICLANFVRILKKFNLEISVFSFLKNSEVSSLDDLKFCQSEIRKADLVIHWSGLNPALIEMVKYANHLDKKVILGSNLIDTVEFAKEDQYLAKIKFSKILTVNFHLKYLIAKRHNVALEKIDVFMVGPDLDLWAPSSIRDGTILWKGNSKHFVKDVNFALELKKMLPQYQFKLIGHPTPYHYFDHISEAKKSKIYITTSLSETMGAALIESWASGLPSVSHPKVHLHGLNYQTGIITNKNLVDYAEAIQNLMEDQNLYQDLAVGCQKYVVENFSDSKIMENFSKVIGEL